MYPPSEEHLIRTMKTKMIVTEGNELRRVKITSKANLEYTGIHLTHTFLPKKDINLRGC